MSEAAELTEQLAVAVVLADPSDPPALLRLHDCFRNVREALPAGASAAASGAASKAEELLKRLILLEEEDGRGVLQQVNQLVAEIQTALGVSSSPETQPKDAEPASTGVFRAEDLSLIHDFVAESREHLDAAEAEVLKLNGGADPESVNAIFRSFHTIKGVAGFLNLEDIGFLAHSAENLLDQARKGKVNLDPNAVGLILESIDVAKAMLSAIETALKDNSILARHDGLAALRSRLDDCAAGKQASAPATPPAKTPAASTAATSSTTNKPADATVKVATDRLDSLINMVGELVITQAMVRQGTRELASTGDQTLNRNLTRLDKITRELQDLSMSMRMIPIQGVFQKMVRLVRDLSGKFGKQIDLTIVGGETELDRNVVEAIADPLVHMIRNAADHGIESPEVREKAGKSATGHIELKAYHLAGQVVIEISDDGKGLNTQRILSKAIDAGIVKPDEHPTDAEVHNLIFHAGLSTAEKITDVSGRGVGMDVVKKNIEALRGHVDIQSTEGKGSSFIIRLPLTLAVIDGLVVRVGAERFIIPILGVEQSLRPEASQISTVQGRGELCVVRGRALRLIRLNRLFGLSTGSEDPTQGLLVVVHDNGREACLLVDELIGQQQVVIKSLGDSFAAARGFSGGAILGDGAVSLIVDIPGIIQLAAEPDHGKEF